jgi:hypothetical protein
LHPQTLAVKKGEYGKTGEQRVEPTAQYAECDGYDSHSDESRA